MTRERRGKAKTRGRMQCRAPFFFHHCDGVAIKANAIGKGSIITRRKLTFHTLDFDLRGPWAIVGSNLLFYCPGVYVHLP